MKQPTPKEKMKLDREAQVFKCFFCDEEKVKWNGERWQCGNCNRMYGKKTVITL